MERDQLWAFCATLATLALVYISSLIAAGTGVTITEAFGLGTITGGLIGALNAPSRRHVEVDNPSDKPVPVKEDPQP